MTTKDYVLVAQSIKTVRPTQKKDPEEDIIAINRYLDRFAREFATRAKADNPRFDKATFFRAAGTKAW